MNEHSFPLGSSAFPFLGIPHRQSKPRTRGLTIVSDRAMPLRNSEDLLEVAPDIIDRIKFVDHSGFLVRYSSQWLRAKTAQYRSAGIGIFPGGVPFEVAVLCNKVQEYMRCLVDLGFTGVEISEDAIRPIPPTDRQRYIGLARNLGLEVFTEVGRKFPQSVMDIGRCVDTISSDLEQGVTAVTLEESDLQLTMQTDPAMLKALVASVGLDRLIFEIGLAGWPHTLADLLRLFGTEINLANIDPDQLLICDSMRYGLFWGEGYSFLTRLSGQEPMDQSPSAGRSG